MIKCIPAGLLAVIAASALATTAWAQDAKTLNALQDALVRTQQFIEHGDSKGAYDLLTKTTASPAFTTEPAPDDSPQIESLRLQLTRLLGMSAIGAGHPEEAKAALRRASEMPRATADVWGQRFNYDLQQNDGEDAATAFLKLADAYPADLRRLVRDQTLNALISQVGRTPDAAERLFLIDRVLLDRDWAPDDPNFGLGSQWMPLAGQLIDRGDKARADKAVAKVQLPNLVHAMRLGKRFDSYVAANPEKFDVAARIKLRLDEVGAAALANPNDLDAVNRLATVLNSYGYSQRALVLLDDTIARVETGPLAASYTGKDKLNWTHDYRAMALAKLGRWDEALAEMERAAKLSEGGAVNASQTLNLSEAYLDAHRWQDAAKMAGKLKRGNVSAYGYLVQQRVLACAAAKLNQPQVQEAALQVLRNPAGGDRRLLQQALFCIGDEDGAAAIAKARLADSRERLVVLVELQDYPPQAGAGGAIYAEDEARSKAFKTRPDIRAAVEAVGRYETQTLSLY